MLPYTTYIIPERQIDKTGTQGKWLWLLLRKPVPDEQIPLLEKISTALKADFRRDTYCLALEQHERITLHDYYEVTPTLILSFGLAPSEFGIWIDLPQYGIRFFDATTLIYAASLPELEKNASLKKELWKHMQQFLERSALHG